MNMFCITNYKHIQQFYADQAHSINIGNAKRHVYRQIDHRLSSCLGKLNSYYPESYLEVEKTKSSDRS